MPELPELEALRAFLVERLEGRRIGRVLPVAVNVLKTYDPPVTALEGRTVREAGRRGKYLVLRTDGPVLVVHLARAGWLRWSDRPPAAAPRPGRGPLALRVGLDPPEDGGFDLTEAGTQKRLAVHVLPSGAGPESLPALAGLGPEPLDGGFTVEVLAELLHGRRHRIKGMLRDQRVIAGIGNAYSDEILHVARLSPYRLASDLTPPEIETLYAALRGTLLEAVERAAGLPAAGLKAEKRSGMRVHGRAGQPCPVCGDTVREVSFHDSSLQYCPTCQTGGRPLADRRMSRLLR